jgi:hypothetical protein
MGLHVRNFIFIFACMHGTCVEVRGHPGLSVFLTFHCETGTLCFCAAHARLASPRLGLQMCPTRLRGFCLFNYVCTYVCLCVGMRTRAQFPWKPEAADLSGAAMTGGCDPSTWVLRPERRSIQEWFVLSTAESSPASSLVLHRFRVSTRISDHHAYAEDTLSTETSPRPMEF